MTRLTANFTLDELTASAEARRLGIANTPDTQAVANLAVLCAMVLQPLREWWGQPIVIGSGYRCQRLNTAVGGVKNSQHMSGQAADLFLDGDVAKGLRWFNYIKDRLPYDQLLFERNAKGTRWLHVSYNAAGNRHYSNANYAG